MNLFYENMENRIFDLPNSRFLIFIFVANHTMDLTATTSLQSSSYAAKIYFHFNKKRKMLYLVLMFFFFRSSSVVLFLL